MQEETYVNLPGSERNALPGAQRIGPVDPEEPVQITVMLRPRQNLPDPARQPYQTQMTHEEYAAAYSADPGDLRNLERFAAAHQLTITAKDLAQRNVKISGSAAAFARAFHVQMHRYSYSGGVFRGREGSISVPQSLAQAIEGVFGLDDRPAAQATP